MVKKYSNKSIDIKKIFPMFVLSFGTIADRKTKNYHMKKFHVSTTDSTDEHSVNVLDSENRLAAIAQVNPYFDFDEAAKNAQLFAASGDLAESLKDLLADVMNLLEMNDSIKLGTMGIIHIVKAKEALKKANIIFPVS